MLDGLAYCKPSATYTSDQGVLFKVNFDRDFNSFLKF